jgi:hypothetical protein
MLVHEETMKYQQNVLFQLQSEKCSQPRLFMLLVEAYVYEVKDKLNSVWEKFIDPKDRHNFYQQLDQTAEWIYEEPDHPKEVYEKRLQELKSVGEAIKKRYQESTTRGAALQELFTAIQECKVHPFVFFHDLVLFDFVF